MTQWLRNSITSQQHCVPAPPFVPMPISIFWRHWCKFQVSKIGASASNCSPKQTNETTEAFVTESTSQQSRGIFSLCNDIPSRSLGISWSATFSRRNSRKLPIQFSLLHREWRVESGCYDATTRPFCRQQSSHATTIDNGPSATFFFGKECCKGLANSIAGLAFIFASPGADDCWREVHF